MSISISGNGTFTGVTTSYSFDAAVSVAGTVTYEDVANVDSVGVVTARSGVYFGAPGSGTQVDGNSTGIGIGTDNPQHNLHLYNNGDATLFIQADADNVDEDHNPKISMSQDGQTSSIFDIGINGSTDNSFTGAVSNTAYLYSVSNATSNGIQFATNGAARMYLNNSGNLGIGTDNPIMRLHVHGAANSTDSRIRLSSIEGSGLTIRAQSATESNFNADAGEDITFSRGNVESLRITSSGDLGIGTTSPDDLLHLSASNSGIGADFTLANNLIRFEDTDITQATNQVIGGFLFEGQDIDTNAAGLQVALTANVAGGTGGGELRFYTAASGDTLDGSDTERMRIDSTGRTIFTKSGDPVVIGGVTNSASIFRDGTNMGGIHFSTNSVLPANSSGNATDNSFDLGSTNHRWDDVFATNGTIQTSDQSLKQDVAQLTDAEIAAAKVIRGLVKKYRWIDSVEEKGDDARIHVGVIAQEVEQAFVDQGLDPNRYGLFCKNSFYTVDGEAMGPDSALYTEDTPGAVLVERRGVRYPQLLAFVMAAVDAEAAAFEARLTALEAN